MYCIKIFLRHPQFLDGSYTTKFVDEEMADKKQESFFSFVDNDVFVVAAAIEAYKSAKLNDVSHQKLAHKWRYFGRVEQLRD